MKQIDWICPASLFSEKDCNGLREHLATLGKNIPKYSEVTVYAHFDQQYILDTHLIEFKGKRYEMVNVKGIKAGINQQTLFCFEKSSQGYKKTTVSAFVRVLIDKGIARNKPIPLD